MYSNSTVLRDSVVLCVQLSTYSHGRNDEVSGGCGKWTWPGWSIYLYSYKVCMVDYNIILYMYVKFCFGELVHVMYVYM